MPGLTASELPVETLYAGDVIEYYSMAFVCGDARGHRRAVVLSVDDTRGEAFPITVDTGEIIPLTNMVKRYADRFNNRFKEGFVKWRKLRTFRLQAGRVRAPARSSTLKNALAGAVEATYREAGRQLRAGREEEGRAPSGQAPRDAEELPRQKHFGSEFSVASSAQTMCLKHLPPPVVPLNEVEAAGPSEEDVAISSGATPKTAIDLATSEPESDDDGRLEASTSGQGVNCELNEIPCDSAVLQAAAAEAGVPIEPSEDQVRELGEYLEKIPTRGERAKIRHQPKRKAAQWLVPRSRKRRHQVKCGPTRSGTNVHHARSLTAKKAQEFLRLPSVKDRLRALHVRRPKYVEAVVDTRRIIKEVLWPVEVDFIKENIIPKDFAFADIGEFDKCKCDGDCFMDTCPNVACAMYCTPDSCNLEAVCSNSVCSRSTLKLFDTGRVGVGVYTTTNLDVGDILGEYCGKLCEYPAIVLGQPDQAKKQNSGYTMLFNAKSARNNYVYIEALNAGFTTRFISHACDPNAAFVELYNGSSVKVLVRMKKDVMAGAQITVNYGKEIWFKCACDKCWGGTKA